MDRTSGAFGWRTPSSSRHDRSQAWANCPARSCELPDEGERGGELSLLALASTAQETPAAADDGAA